MGLWKRAFKVGDVARSIILGVGIVVVEKTVISICSVHLTFYLGYCWIRGRVEGEGITTIDVVVI